MFEVQNVRLLSIRCVYISNIFSWKRILLDPFRVTLSKSVDNFVDKMVFCRWAMLVNRGGPLCLYSTTGQLLYVVFLLSSHH